MEASSCCGLEEEKDGVGADVWDDRQALFLTCGTRGGFDLHKKSEQAFRYECGVGEEGS